jgi:hypothetical protein
VLDQHLPRPKEEPDMEKSEPIATFLDEVRGLEAARKYIHQSDTKNITTVMRNKAETELHTLTAQGEEKQKNDW